MYAVLNLDLDTVALYETRPYGSEVLLFKRAQGLLSKLRIPERGEAVEERLLRSFRHIAGRMPKTPDKLFVAKSLDGIHLGSSGSGNGAKDNADARSNQNGDDCRHS